MLIDPRQPLQTIPGTRLLVDHLSLYGRQIVDPLEPWRPWVVQWVYAPVNRMIGGVRTKLIDSQGFITFCNQRDLEVLLGLGEPGRRCHWLGSEYVSTDSQDWYGLCTDSNDLVDDLFDRELLIRNGSPQQLCPPMEITRRIHLDHNNDCEELYTLLWDADPVTQIGPDYRVETVDCRWSRVERTKVYWR